VFSLVEVLQIACLIPVIGGSVFSILSIWSMARFFKRSKSLTEKSIEFKPPVTVLKPVRGLEKNLKSQLSTICTQDYPEYQVIYSVQDLEDPALPILKEIQEEIGSQLVSVVISQVEAGANGKVNNLLGAMEKARHDIIIISDSDTYLRPNYIENIVAPLSNPQVGCVCTLFKAVQAQRWFEKVELLSINTDFIPSVIFAAVTGASHACLGPSVAISRATLQELGGLESLADYLVEDYELGRRVWTSGKEIAILPYVIDVAVDLENWHDWWNHQVYWDQNTYLARPGPFIATILIRAVPFALLFATVRLADPLGLAVLATALALRLLTAAITSKQLHDTEGLRSIHLLPLRDTLGLVFWLLSFTKRTVVWRGIEFRLTKNGKMIRRYS
jgi:ceramide glucosyltransferase